MSKSAQSIQRSAYMMLGFVFLFGGLGFGFYLWNATKIYDAQAQESGGGSGARTAVARFAPTLSLKVEDRGATGLQAVATLTNNTNVPRLVIPDLMSIEPLYAVGLKYAPAKGAELHDFPRVPALQNHAANPDAAAPVMFNTNRDVTIDLLPGRAHLVAIPLGQWYALKPGHYELRVAFRPTDLVPGEADQTVPACNVMAANATLVFDYPLEKPASAAAPGKSPDVPAQNVEATQPAK